MVPDTIPEALGESSDLNEILWNFGRFKDGRRLTLKDNPHFYKMLPTSAQIYKGNFRIDPIEDFHRDIHRDVHHEIISVLTDSPRLTGRMILKIAEEARVFSNIWLPMQTIIFKGSYLSALPFPIP